MDKIRVGFVGLGHNGLAHIEAHRRVGRSKIAAVCDLDPKRLKEARERFDVPDAYRSADELCASDRVDAVSIHTGDPFHVEPFVAAVGNGRHVLCEKPLANTPGQVETMVQAARSADPRLKLAVGYILRFNPVFAAVHDLCREGQLGEVYYLEADYIHNLLYQAQQTDARTGGNWYLQYERPMVGGGSHQLDLLRWFAGSEVVEAGGYANHVAFPAMEQDDCQVAVFRFDSGAIAKVAALYAPRTERPPFCNLRVYGTTGTVERDQVAIARHDRDLHPAFEPIQARRIEDHPFDDEVADWLDAIRDDRPPRCDLFDGANSTMAALVATEAIAAGKPLPVPVLGR